MDLIELTDVIMELPGVIMCYIVFFIIGVANVKIWK